MRSAGADSRPRTRGGPPQRKGASAAGANSLMFPRAEPRGKTRESKPLRPSPGSVTLSSLGAPDSCWQVAASRGLGRGDQRLCTALKER